MLGASDTQQIDHAINNGYVLLTHNRADYVQLYSKLIAEGREHNGVIIATRRNVYELARRVSRVLSFYTKESIKNRIVYI